MLDLVAALLILALILGPQFWVRHVMDRHAADRPDLPGTRGELDASFGRALPILDDGGYLHPADMPAARGVLRAAAMTHVAASLTGLLDFPRILRAIR